MATDFVITAENNPQIFRDVSFKDAAVQYSFDFSPWADDNAALTSAAWTVKAGTATVSGAALASNVATALVTFGSAGSSLIQIKGVTTSNGTYVAYLDVIARDILDATSDYGTLV